MQISRLQTPGLAGLTEKTTTGNVSAHGVRVLTKRALLPQERLLVTSPISSEEPIRARVVYCQPLAEGVFGVGLQFEKGEAVALTEASQPDIRGPGRAGNAGSRRAEKRFFRWSNQFLEDACGEFLFQP
jgi:PilZ domain